MLFLLRECAAIKELCGLQRASLNYPNEGWEPAPQSGYWGERVGDLPDLTGL